jgi:putative ABC transport system substrate-binding protein
MRRYLRLVQFGFILLLVLTCMVPPALTAPVAAPLVAVILPRDTLRFQVIHKAFLREFEKINTAVGKPNLYLQSPSADVMSLRNSIRKATALGADLIIVYGTRAAMAAQYEDFTEPLIFADVFDPVAMKLVPSLERGGPLMTGVCGHAPLQTLFKTLQEILGTVRLGFPAESKYQASMLQAEVLRKAACRRDAAAGKGENSLGSAQLCSLEVIPMDMQTPGEMVRILNTSRSTIDAVYLGELLPTDRHVTGILEYAAQAGLPVISTLSGSADKGALLSLEADPDEQGELLVDIVAHMLEGDLPEDVPVKMPRRVSLVINLKVASQLGIDVPFPVLLQTTRVIR